MEVIPRIALVGRPNVGKSTLFNRVCGRRKAIVDGRPGSTRDRNYAQASWQGNAFELVDTGGLLLASKDPLLGPAADQARTAIAEADVVIMVVDGRAGLLPDDEAIARELRTGAKRVLVAVNKVEGADDVATEFAALGFDSVLAISAEHGLGVGDLLDAAFEGLARVPVEEEAEAPLRLAIVGRPNVGKSSILNRLIGEDRALVSSIPGTTRDSVDSMVLREGRVFHFVDTAGIRRSRLLKDNVDHVSVVQARRSLEQADVGLVVLDPVEGIREMDATIAGYAVEANRGVVIVVNKWDLSKENEITQKHFTEAIRDELKFLSWAPIVFVSAQTGSGMSAIFSKAARVHQAQRHRITTGELNRVITRAQEKLAPKADRGRGDLRILFAAQIGVAPPTFAISVNQAVDLHFSYRRYLENQIRQAFGFDGTPIVLKVRTRRRNPRSR